MLWQTLHHTPVGPCELPLPFGNARSGVVLHGGLVLRDEPIVRRLHGVGESGRAFAV